MNNKQKMIIVIGVLAVILIVIFTPRYKIVVIGPDNFIKTEQTSALYKRSKGTVKLHWDWILIYSGITAIICALLLFALGDKDGQDHILDKKPNL